MGEKQTQMRLSFLNMCPSVFICGQPGSDGSSDKPAEGRGKKGRTLRLNTTNDAGNAAFAFSLFTKPWTMPLTELGPFVRGLGFDAVELPVRPGFQVMPADAAARLPEAVRVLGDAGVRVRSVAAHPTPALIATVGELGIPLIRTLAPIPDHLSFWQAVDLMRAEWDRLLPDLSRAGVTLGIQNHCDRYLTHAMHLWYALRDYDPR
jgi:sugar phosphate isomerase/epimerase